MAMSAYAALSEAGYRACTRDKTTLFLTFAFPLLFLVVSGPIFHGQQVEQSGKPYINYIAPGVLSRGVANAVLTGDGGIADIGLACAGVTGFALVFAAVALRTFRWSDRA